MAAERVAWFNTAIASAAVRYLEGYDVKRINFSHGRGRESEFSQKEFVSKKHEKGRSIVGEEAGCQRLHGCCK